MEFTNHAPAVAYPSTLVSIDKRVWGYEDGGNAAAGVTPSGCGGLLSNTGEQLAQRG